MNIIVCIKQVPDTEEVKTDPKTGSLIREGVAATVNPFDMYGIEEAVRMREKYGGSVTAVSMGPPATEHSLRYALAMGCDKAVLLSDRAFAGADTLATSYSIAAGIRKIGVFDVVFTGTKTTDGDTGQVGAGVAEFLGVPVVYYVTRIIEVGDGRILVERLLEDRVQVLSVQLPCVLSVVKGINTPRLPTLHEKIESERKPLIVYNAGQVGSEPELIGLNGSPTKVVKMFPPEKRRKGAVIRGEPRDVAVQLVDFMQEQKLFKGD
jgi:electron transfer flavoprotein beta subunit